MLQPTTPQRGPKTQSYTVKLLVLITGLNGHSFLFVDHFTGLQCWILGWQINWKGLSLDQGLSQHLLGELRKGSTISDGTASVLADIQADHLLDTSLVHYCYTKPLNHNMMTYLLRSLLCVLNILSNVRISCYGQNSTKKQPLASVGSTTTPICHGSQVSQSRVGFLLFLQSALPREPLLQWLGETRTHTNHCQNINSSTFQALSTTTNLWPKKVAEIDPAICHIYL